MKSRFTSLIAFLLAIVTMLAVGKAQNKTRGLPPRPVVTQSFAPPEGISPFRIRSDGPQGFRNGPQAPTQKALDQLKNAKNDKEKQAASAKLREQLNKQFDADMKRRESELAAIQVKLQQMQSALQKRTDNKESIVGLRLQVLTNQAEGLGWQSGYRQPAEYDPFAQGIQSLPQRAEAPRFRPTPDEAHLFRSKP